MKNSKKIFLTKNQNNPFLLLAIAAFLSTIYFASIWQKLRSDLVVSDLEINDLVIGGLFLFVVGSMVWEKRQDLTLSSSLIAKLVGGLLIVLMLLKLSPALFQGAPFVLTIAQRAPIASVKVSIFIFALGLGIIASGFQGLKQYWRELTIIFCFSIPPVLLFWLNFSPITAKFSAFLLWCLGFNVYLQNVYIYLPTGSVEVYKGCSGLIIMNYLFGISVMLLFMFPLRRIYTIIVPITAVIIGFVLNGFRVVLMAILVASRDTKAFDYWHTGDGSLVFTVIASAIFVAFYFWLIRYSGTADVN